MDLWRRFGWSFYDNMGGVVLGNLVCGLGALPWVACGWILVHAGAALPGAWQAAGFVAAWAAALAALAAAPPSLMLHALALDWVRGQGVAWDEAWARVRRCWVRGLVLGGLGAAVGALLVFNLFFYLDLGGLLGAGLAGLMVWALVAWGAVGLFVPSVLLTQGGGVAATLRQSALLALGNIRMSLLMAAGAVLGAVLAGITVVGGLVGVWAAVVLFECACFVEVLGRYTGGAEPVPSRSFASVLRPWDE